MRKSRLKRFMVVLKRFEQMTRTEIISRLKWIKDKSLTHDAAEAEIQQTIATTGCSYGVAATALADRHGFSNWITLKCLLLMKDKYAILQHEIPAYPVKNWQEVKEGVVRRKAKPTA